MKPSPLTTKDRPPHKAAFSLIELLVVIVIGGMLIALCIPAISKFKTHANTVRCTSNLKTIGQVLFAYASDHNGKTVTAFEVDPVTAVAGNMWPDALRTQGYLTLAEERKIMACPAYSPYKYSAVGFSTLAYGLRRISTPWENRFDPAYTAGKAPKPSSYVLVADSIDPAAKRQFYYLDYPGMPAKPNQIHLRHSGKANILFGDGSVRPLSKQEILDLGDGWTQNGICEGNP